MENQFEKIYKKDDEEFGIYAQGFNDACEAIKENLIKELNERHKFLGQEQEWFWGIAQQHIEEIKSRVELL